MACYTVDIFEIEEATSVGEKKTSIGKQIEGYGEEDIDTQKRGQEKMPSEET
jgi:hypothetical protein